MIDSVFVLVFARADDGKFAGGLIGGEDEGLGGGVAGGFEHDVFAIAGAAGADVEALIVVLVDEDVVGMRRVQCVAVKLKLALLLFVFDGVESCFVVVGPGDRAYALDFSGEGFTGSRSLMRRVYWRKPVVSTV